MLQFKLLLLLWAVNTAPPLLAFYLDRRWNAPLDRGLTLSDGKRLLGDHKTVRGVLGGMAAGMAVGTLLGLGPWIGLAAGALSMLGDLLSSFLKRRLDVGPGGEVPGLDQLFEGLLPLLALAAVQGLGWGQALLLTGLFCVGAYAASHLYQRLLLTPPSRDYTRPVKPRIRLREITSCHIRSPFLARFFNFEDGIYYHLLIHAAFKAAGLYDRGMANALDFRVRRVSLAVPGLPPAFHGLRVLLLTDLHLDGLPGLTERLKALLPGLEADLCVLGGDYRMHTYGPTDTAMHRLFSLLPLLRAPEGTVGVLGNHDCFEMAAELEARGVRMLLNDSTFLERQGENGPERLYVAGVDDPHYYRSHDPDLAFAEVPPGSCCVFVCHTPRLYKQAARRGAALYLTGHTHAGQVQVPPVGPVFTHTPAPRRICQGAWEYKGMRGYTSAGVGVSGVPLRFHCRGEIALLTLLCPGRTP